MTYTEICNISEKKLQKLTKNQLQKMLMDCKTEYLTTCSQVNQLKGQNQMYEFENDKLRRKVETLKELFLEMKKS